jgi:hypothetical protein
MAYGFDVSTMTAWVDAQSSLKIKQVYGANTLKYVNVVPGIKGTMLLPKATTTPILQANACGWNASGSTVVGNATITVSDYKVEDSYCVSDLIATALQKELAAGASETETLPFEQEFVSGIVNGIAKLVENRVWDASDGFYSQITAANGSVSAGTLTLTTAANVLSAVESMILLIPADIQAAEDIVLFLNPGNFMKLAAGIRATYGLLALVNSAADQLGNEFMFPGSNVKVVKAFGLGSSNRFYLGQASNFVVGTDLVSDYETLELWYEKKDDAILTRSKFRVGTQVIFADQIVYSNNA